ncbi:DUF4974 domain-containing protein [Prolixibacteraceae bacterium JC049]|nr:DUF4974 domain-containing protein [Prolixibacteraceae bacterium JC049]
MKVKKEDIDKWLNGDCSFNVVSKMQEALSQKKIDNALNIELEHDWNNQKEEKDKELVDSLYEKVHYKILLKEKAYRLEHKKKVSRWLQIAASLMIPLALAVYLNIEKLGSDTSENLVEIVAPEGARTRFALPDGSYGWLAGGSVLKYDVRFNKNRNVEIDGKGFFSVKHDPAHPFVVNMSQYNVKVLGTRFDVCNYSNDSICEVVVTDGRVNVDNTGGELAQILVRNQAIRLNKNSKQFRRRQVNADDYSAWIDGRLVFTNDPLRVVAEKIKRHYGVDVVLRSFGLENQMFRAKVRIGSLEELMHYLTLTMPVAYEIKPGEKQRDGTISKRKLIIYQKK